jgi:GT2 family glycosyltransferase
MVSIIIVHYHADEELYSTLNSIQKNKPQTPFEIIVVDNDEKIRIKNELKEKFPQIKYIKGPSLGFGAGNNLGAKHAKGEYMFFLNPDTRIFPGTVDALVTFLENQTNIGIVAPQLLHPDKTPFEQQGCILLTPLRGIIVLSFINKVFPDNPVSKAYWQTGWDKTKLKQVDVAPGTAFMIVKKLYEEMHGFDENFFLYFEEFDLCKRIREKGYKIFISPKAKIIHLWGKGGTAATTNINTIYKQSRMYYFKKHYGIFNMLLVEAFARFGKKQFLFLIVLTFVIIALFTHLT